MREERTAGPDTLAEIARRAFTIAYAPYSGFHVGAALEAADGRTFPGCNVENASYPVTLCAERVALGSAIAAGARAFTRLHICSDADEPIAPCGMCRQALAELAPDIVVVSESAGGGLRSWRLEELLPERFALRPELHAPQAGDR